MPTYPRDAAERRAERIEAIADALSTASRSGQPEPVRAYAAACLGSDPWTPGRHAPDPGGCTDDGSGCLCPCHDPEE